MKIIMIGHGMVGHNLSNRFLEALQVMEVEITI